jgi:photosystem II stability/assembly factor-like uncharacterized protein
LQGVYFVDPEYGWVVGDGGTILHSTDGGRSWVGQVSNTRIDLNGVWFGNRSIGWITGWNFNYGKPYSIVLRTEDGGEHWEKAELPRFDALLHISFVDLENGWLAGSASKDGDTYWESRGLVVHTTDGGNSWEFYENSGSSTSVGFYYPVIAITFVDAREGWATDSTDVYHTTNGGESWELQYKKMYDPHHVYGFRDLHFLDNLTGWASGRRDGQSGHMTGILHTTDGGQTWNESFVEGSSLARTHFFNSTTGIGVGAAVPPGHSGDWRLEGLRDGVIMLTTDAGQTWNEIFRLRGKDLYDVFFTSSDNGWAVGERGTILSHKH